MRKSDSRACRYNLPHLLCVIMIDFYLAALKKQGKLNSHAVGMAAAQSYGFKVNLLRDSISGSAALFFVSIFKFILISIFEIKISKKNSSINMRHYKVKDFKLF